MGNYIINIYIYICIHIYVYMYIYIYIYIYYILIYGEGAASLGLGCRFGIKEKKMETVIVWLGLGLLGSMEKNMESTTVCK